MIRLKMLMGVLKTWKWLTSGKCKYYNVCELRNPEQPACTTDRGQYYDFGKYPGCYRTLERKRQ